MRGAGEDDGVLLDGTQIACSKDFRIRFPGSVLVSSAALTTMWTGDILQE